MKRLLIAMTCIAMLFSMVVPASAYESSEEVVLLTEESAEPRAIIRHLVSDTNSADIFTGRISVGGSVSTKSSSVYFGSKTDTLKLRLTGSASNSFRITLYTEGGVKHSSKSLSATTSEKTVSFSVTAYNYYYIVFENTGSSAAGLSGSIKGS